MPKLLKEPLFQFMIGGLFLYLMLAAFGPVVRENDPYVIPVNDDALLLYLQYQDKAFDTAGARKALNSLDAGSRVQLEQDYIRDEVMVREALALSLDTNDEVIRRRLILKMDYIVQGFGSGPQATAQKEIDAYFAAHRDAYQIEAEATFTHIFFNAEKRGAGEARQAAQDLLKTLNHDTVPFEQAGNYGDRFYFLRNYVTRPQRLVSDHFGAEMTEKIFEKIPSNQWIGPFTSKYGTHLLMIRHIAPGRSAELSEVRGLVTADLEREYQDKTRRAAIEKLTKKYTILRGEDGQ